jgi:hypothetical protein
MESSNETQQYARVGAWWVLLQGFREDSGRALGDVAICAFIFALLFGALFLKEIMLWIRGVLG